MYEGKGKEGREGKGKGENNEQSFPFFVKERWEGKGRENSFTF